jgi:hypothetical protein
MRVRPAVTTAFAALATAVLVAPGAAAQQKQVAGGSTALLKRVERSFTAPAAGGKRDLSPMLRRLATQLPSLRGSARRRATSILARPTDGAADPQQNGWTVPEAAGSPVCSAHFCVHWVASGRDAPNLTDGNGNGVPDWVENVAGVAENVYSVENGQLGWRTPKSDGTRGGGGPGKTDIYLADIGGSGIYGYTAPDPNQGGTSGGHSLFSYLVLDNDFARAQFPQYSTPVDPLDVTLAHEYNHVLHFTYDALEDTWMFEATAVWMEGRVYQPVFDYLQYLPGWSQLTTQPITTFNGSNPSDRNNVKVYGSAVWTKWLDARYGPDVVRSAWEDSRTTHPASFAPRAFDAAIRQHGGHGFSDEFDRFAAATAEWQAQNSGFPDGALYPDVKRSGSLGFRNGRRTVTLDHTAFALIRLPSSTSRRVKLTLKAPRGTACSLALAERAGGLPGGTTTDVVHVLPHGGTASISIPAGAAFDRLTAVVVNSDIGQRGFSSSLDDWRFTKNRQRFVLSAR